MFSMSYFSRAMIVLASTGHRFEPTPVVLTQEGEPEYEVKKILQHKKIRSAKNCNSQFSGRAITPVKLPGN